MSWLERADAGLFRFINLKLSHPILDAIVPLFSTNPLFYPAILFFAIWLLWKGGARGRVLVVMMAVILAIGDNLVINTLKHAFGRMRPFHSITDAILLVGRGSSGSMPSSHTATWFAMLLMSYVYYPRSWRFMLPLALLVSFSRIYVGVHYPSDVLIGAVLGAGYAAAGLVVFNWLWQVVGRMWFGGWWQRMPSLLDPPPASAEATRSAVAQPVESKEWLRLGYVLIAILTVARLAYIASDTIELSEDEAYQWLWSKHLALSYYSKPPMIAFLQFAGTTLWGDNAFGVRFFSPVIAALLSTIILRFMTRMVDARAAFWTVMIVTCTPLLAVGATLMTVDPPLVLFWTAAMVVGWSAMQPSGTMGHWMVVGLCIGLAFLSKYTALFQVACWACCFCLLPSARNHLRRPGPWVALLIAALCTLPVLIWNAQHQWITVDHVAYNAGRTSVWKPGDALKYVGEFVGAEAALLNPIVFAAALWAMATFWRRTPGSQRPLLVFLFSMGAPVFLGYLLFSTYKRVFPNWIAPAVLPMLCLAAVYWYGRSMAGTTSVRGWLTTGVCIGCAAVVILHNTDLTKKLINRTLPPAIDPLRRVRGWSETAALVGAARARLDEEGTPAFIICDHYGLTAEISFYLPRARQAARFQPLVYYKTARRPNNQFYFWPGYRGARKGQSAVFVREINLPELQRDWLVKWLRGDKDLYEDSPPETAALPPELVKEFDSVSQLGIVDIKYKGRALRRLQLFACRNLRL